MSDKFGKGERSALDRSFRPAVVDYEGELFPHEGFFHNLRKVFHTFMYDMKEFLVDFYGVSTEDYVNTLFWLTYLQSWVYEIDTMVELGKKVDFERFFDQFMGFLKENDLYTDYIRDNILKGVREFWMDQSIKQKVKDPSYLDEVMFLKSLDITLSRRVALIINQLPEDEHVLRIWNTFDKIREIFDDVRDVWEDRGTENTNVVLGLLEHGEEKAKRVLLEYVSGSLRKVEKEIITFSPPQREVLGAILGKLHVEKLYYLNKIEGKIENGMVLG